MLRTFGQLVAIALVATLVTLGVNLALLPRLPARFPLARATSTTVPGVPPLSGGALPVALRTTTAQPPDRVTLPTPDPRASGSTTGSSPFLVAPTAARPGTAQESATGNQAAAGIVPCQIYPLAEVLAAFRRADLPLRDSLFDPAAPGTDQPFPITAVVRDYARGVAGVPGLRLDVFILADEAQARVLQGDAGRWAHQQQRQVRIFPYRNVALVFYEADPARAVPYERALVQLP